MVRIFEMIYSSFLATLAGSAFCSVFSARRLRLGLGFNGSIPSTLCNCRNANNRRACYNKIREKIAVKYQIISLNTR